MSKTQYGMVLISAALMGFLGGITANQLGQRGVMPRLLIPKNIRVQKGFEIVDQDGKRRAVLDNNALVFLGADAEWRTKLGADNSELLLYDSNTHSSVKVSPFEPYVIRFTQSAARHSPSFGIGAGIGEVGPAAEMNATPKLGIAIKDGQVIWTVP